MKKIIRIEGMTCHHCEMRVEKALKAIRGVKSAKASFAEKTCIIDVKFDIEEDIIREIVKQAGYHVVAVE